MGLRHSIEKRYRRWRKRLLGDPDLAQLRRLSQKYRDRRWIVMGLNFCWNEVLFQRPHHLARELSKLGFLYFWRTADNLDRISGFREVAPGLVLTDRFDLVTRHAPKDSILHAYSTDNASCLKDIRALQSEGWRVLYEYVDHIHEMISAGPIPSTTYDKHHALLAEEDVWVIATADRLVEEVARARRRNYALITNGVECSHFGSERSREENAPPVISGVLARGKRIVGYFGALAPWLDEALLETVSMLRPDLEFVLIGREYEGYRVKGLLRRCGNISWLGPVPYRELPRTARWFDVAILPFVINDVTLSTSPIKLFEYMALGKPVVTTDLPECRKYPCLLVARNAEEFRRHLDTGLRQSSEANCVQALRACAAENDWHKKAQAVLDLITRPTRDYQRSTDARATQSRLSADGPGAETSGRNPYSADDGDARVYSRP